MATDPLADASASFLAGRDGLLAFVRSQVRDPGEADDLLQEVWVELAEALGAGQAVEAPVAWCRTVLRNRIVDRWRRRGRQPDAVDLRLLDLAAAACAEHDAAADLRADRLEALRRCLAAVQQRPRRLLDLCYRQGLSAAEAAQRTGSTAEAVLMALSRARRALGQCIERRLAGVAS
jgi:RNA polymerase sigma-70 factor (ECF subfamily)